MLEDTLTPFLILGLHFDPFIFISVCWCLENFNTNLCLSNKPYFFYINSNSQFTIVFWFLSNLGFKIFLNVEIAFLISFSDLKPNWSFLTFYFILFLIYSIIIRSIIFEICESMEIVLSLLLLLLHIAIQ